MFIFYLCFWKNSYFTSVTLLPMNQMQSAIRIKEEKTVPINIWNFIQIKEEERSFGGPCDTQALSRTSQFAFYV